MPRSTADRRAFASGRPNVTLSLLDDDHSLVTSLAAHLARHRGVSGSQLMRRRSEPVGRRGDSWGGHRRRPAARSAAAGRAEGGRQDLPDTLRVGVSSGGSVAVRTVPLEDYVAGVLVGEAARDSAPAALDALAIAIRTYALHNLNRHRADGFDICDQTHCQVLRTATPATEQAALRTAGQILRFRARSPRSSTAPRAADGPKFPRRSGRVRRPARICRRGPTMAAAAIRLVGGAADGRPRTCAARVGLSRHAAPSARADARRLRTGRANRGRWPDAVAS